MNNRIQVHCGGLSVNQEELKAYELPEQTSSYHPVPHYELAEFVKSAASDILKATPIREQYAVAKDGQRMFGLQVFGEDSVKCPNCFGSGRIMDEALEEKIDCPVCDGTGWKPNEYGLGVAFRNSYDKSMSIGIAMGFNVFVCDNLCISGEIKIMRKHTKHCWDDIDQTLVHTLYRKRMQLEESFGQDVVTLKQRNLNRDDGYRQLGYLMGNRVMTVTQLSVAMAKWNDLATPTEAVKPNVNAWNLYNSCTEALKSTPPNKVMEAHRSLHEHMMVM